MFCTKCGTELKKDSTVCSSCGTQNSAAVGSSLIIQASQQPIVVLTGKASKEKHTTFLFITSMIFMIFFAIRVVSGFAGIRSWKTIKQTEGVPDDITEIISKLYNSVILNLIIIVLTFAAVLTFFIIIATLRGNHESTAKQKAKLSKVIFIFSIIVTVCGAVYLISDCIILSQLDDFINRATNYTQIDQEVLDDLKGSAIGSLIFDITFIAFGIVNILKSLKLFKVLKAKEKENQQKNAAELA